MLKNNFSKMVAAFAVMAMMAPGLALANGSGHNDDNNKVRFGTNVSSTNEFGVQILGERDGSHDKDKNKDNDRGKFNRDGDRHDNGKHLGWFKDFKKGMAASGEVTAISSTGFTFTAKDGTSINVNTGDAKIVLLPNATLNTEVSVGDRAHVIGDRTDNSIDATKVFDFEANLKPAIAKGTVTAVTDDSITVQTDADSTVTVNTNGETKVIDADGNATTMAEVDTNDEVKLFGFWNSMLNVFHAIKIRLF